MEEGDGEVLMVDFFLDVWMDGVDGAMDSSGGGEDGGEAGWNAMVEIYWWWW